MTINFIDDNFTCSIIGDLNGTLHNEHTSESFALIPLSSRVHEINDRCIAEFNSPIMDTSLLVPNNQCLASEQYKYMESYIDEEEDFTTQIAKANEETSSDVSITVNIVIEHPSLLGETPLDDKNFIIDMSENIISSGKSAFLNLLMHKKAGNIVEDVLIYQLIIKSNLVENIKGDLSDISQTTHQLNYFVSIPLSSMLPDLYARMVELNKHILNSDKTSLLVPNNQCFSYEEYINALPNASEKEDCKEYAHIISSSGEKEDLYITSYKGIMCKSSIFIMIALSYKSGPNLLLNSKIYIQALLTYTAVSMLEYKFNALDTKNFVTDYTASLISSGKSAFLGLLMNQATGQLVKDSLEGTPLKQIMTKNTVQVVSTMLSVIPYTYVLNIESSIKNLYSQSDEISKPQEDNLISEAIYAGGGEINRIMTKQLIGPYNHVVYALFSTVLKEARELYEGSDISGKEFGHLFVRIFMEKKSSQVIKSFTDRNDIYTLSIIKAQSKVISKKVLSSLT